MSRIAGETSVAIQPYGRGGYFNGVYKREAKSIFQLSPDITERFIDALDARSGDGQVNTRKLYERILPIGRFVGEALREKLDETQGEPLCRKGSAKNCGVEISSGFGSIVFDSEGDGKKLQPYIITHAGCGTALIDKVESNAAAEAPIMVENASPLLQFDIGCYEQIEAAVALAGQMMLEELVKLEATLPE